MGLWLSVELFAMFGSWLFVVSVRRSCHLSVELLLLLAETVGLALFSAVFISVLLLHSRSIHFCSLIDFRHAQLATFLLSA